MEFIAANREFPHCAVTHCDVYITYIGVLISPSSSLGPVANATDVMQLQGLLYYPLPQIVSVVPTFASSCLHDRNDARDPRSERLNSLGVKVPEFCLNGDFHVV